MLSPNRVDVVILCGGEGRRLRSVVSDRPKPLAEVAGKPFLAHLIRYAAGFGLRRFVLCAGYKADQVEAFAKRMSRPDLAVECSVEDEPLGTGGALRLALDMLSSDPVLVMNGDSFCEADLGSFLRFHRERRAPASLVLAKTEGASRFGAVEADSEGRVFRFAEKAAAASSSWINAGVYLLGQTVLRGIPAGRPFSLERDLFPGLVGSGLHGFPCGGVFIDIGVPEDLARADAFFPLS